MAAAENRLTFVGDEGEYALLIAYIMDEVLLPFSLLC
jgi:hypothetical protein